MKKQSPCNFIHASQGKNDECYTERYAVEPLLEFLEDYSFELCKACKKNWFPHWKPIIWCPFDTEESEFVKVFQENGYRVEFSHIKYGQDFFSYEPKEWDIMISNPPWTGKRYIVRRALSFNKPFALLLPITWLNDAAPHEEFEGKDRQELNFKKRMQFKNYSGKINYLSVYYCWNFLPKQIVTRDFVNINQKKLF